MSKILSIILSGGKGTRLSPLTKYRSKPDVPFGGKYRIIDIPLSNCINSEFKDIYILTQFNSASLSRHIAKTYSFDSFSNGFVEILSADNTQEESHRYEGTADSIRKNLAYLKDQDPTQYLILSGDQLYRMDLNKLLEFHKKTKSDITIACTTVNRIDASNLGIIKIDSNFKIIDFIEKPDCNTNIDNWEIIGSEHNNFSKEHNGNYLASMGIYIFNAEIMEKCLGSNAKDFGKDIIPNAIKKYKVSAFQHKGYWVDIGTIKSFYNAMLDLTKNKPKFNFYDIERPIYTHNRNLPPAKINSSELNYVTCSDGCIIENAKISNSVIGIRTIINTNCILNGVICMGADYYQQRTDKIEDKKKGIPNIGIGKNCKIFSAIIDKNARIGNNVSIGYRSDKKDGDYSYYNVIDGIYVITKNAIIPDNTII